MKVHIVFDVLTRGRRIHGVYGDEMLALREAHTSMELPRGVKRRTVEAFAVTDALALRTETD